MIILTDETVDVFLHVKYHIMIRMHYTDVQKNFIDGYHITFQYYDNVYKGEIYARIHDINLNMVSIYIREE